MASMLCTTVSNASMLCTAMSHGKNAVYYSVPWQVCCVLQCPVTSMLCTSVQWQVCCVLQCPMASMLCTTVSNGKYALYISAPWQVCCELQCPITSMLCTTVSHDMCGVYCDWDTQHTVVFAACCSVSCHVCWVLQSPVLYMMRVAV